MKIPITKPLIEDDDIAAAMAPLKTGWLVQGPRAAEFEDKVAECCNVKYAIAVSSCTTALHLMLLAAGIGPGDKVVVPGFTYIATANAVEHAGAKPIFVDIDIDTFNLSIDKFGEYIAGCKSLGEALPKAVVPVHLFGLCADMGAINDICVKNSIVVLEDAACAIGSSYKSQPAGSFGLSACFSFHPRKVITTGEGGMVTTNDEQVNKQIRILRDHGAETSDFQRHKQSSGLMPEFNSLGYNYRMTDIQAGLGVSQIGKLQRLINARVESAEYYSSKLKNITWLTPPVCAEDYKHTYQSYVCRVDQKNKTANEIGDKRDSLINYLADKGVSARPGTHAVHLQNYYKNKYSLTPDQLPASFMADRCSIALPLYYGISREEQDYVVETVSKFKVE